MNRFTSDQVYQSSWRIVSSSLGYCDNFTSAEPQISCVFAYFTQGGVGKSNKTTFEAYQIRRCILGYAIV